MSKCAHGVEVSRHSSDCADCCVEALVDTGWGYPSGGMSPLTVLTLIEQIAHVRGWACDELFVVMPLRQVQVVMQGEPRVRPATFNGQRGIAWPGASTDLRVVAARRDTPGPDITVERHGDVLLRIPGGASR